MKSLLQHPQTGQTHSAAPSTSQPRQAQKVPHGAATIAHSPRMTAQRQAIRGAFGPAAAATQRAAASEDAPNLTGMPNQLKSGIEALSGMDLSDVRVRRNSDKPAQLNALAYAQGNDIHLGPGQEQHLGHEAWHVVQQRQGRVQATMQMAGLPVNANIGLEKEADSMAQRVQEGAGAAREAPREHPAQDVQRRPIGASAKPVLQRAGTKPNQPTTDGKYRVKLSSEREAFSYENKETLGIGSILAYHEIIDTWVTDESGENITSVNKNDGEEAQLERPIPVPGPSQKVLLISTIGYTEEEGPRGKIGLDVKIGKYTKSGEQFQREGAGWWWRQIKKIEHNFKDLKRGNRTSGYDIDGGNLATFNEAHTNVDKMAPLGSAMDAVHDEILRIKSIMETAPITFVGSSLFIVFNLDHPEISDVKLIDPDHPIVFPNPDLQDIEIPGGVTTSENITNKRGKDEYVEKWKNSFETGMGNFVEWFENQRTGLPQVNEEPNQNDSDEEILLN